MQPTFTVSDNQVISDKPELTSTLLADCVRACVEAQLTCTACADAALADDAVADMRRCIRNSLDCAEIAGLTARMLVRFVHSDASLLRAQLLTCTRACVACEAECRTHTGQHCEVCADACLRCDEKCREVLRSLTLGN